MTTPWQLPTGERVYLSSVDGMLQRHHFVCHSGIFEYYEAKPARPARMPIVAHEGLQNRPKVLKK